MEKKYWKSQGILSSRKSGNPVRTGQRHGLEQESFLLVLVYVPVHVWLKVNEPPQSSTDK